MKTTYKITDSSLFNEKVVDVNIERLTYEMNVEIELTSGERIEIQGEIGERDFEDEYGFILVNEY